MFDVFGFYKFITISSLEKKKIILQKFLIQKKIRGTIILSPEGINGTIAGNKKNINSVINKLKKILKFKEFNSHNLSKSNFQPFHRPKIKVKKEVVPMNFPLTDKKRANSNHVDPSKWNDLIKNKNTLVLDSRKPFEYKVGTFKRSINPDVDNFREFPKFLTKLKKDKPIAMFCTGGIRCEKASVFLEQKGFKNVYQLKGGILNYLKKIKKEKSLWKGECFVFDNRISVQHGLKVGNFSMCSGCRTPISLNDKNPKNLSKVFLVLIAMIN
jgi:UPF0176 protein